MDPIDTINPKKDSTLAMMEAASRRGWRVSHIDQRALFVDNGLVKARSQELKLTGGNPNWCENLASNTGPIDEFDAVFMRKDPPFNMDYIYSTYLLEMAERSGVPVLNRPGSIRDCNEKLFALQFPACLPPHIVSADQQLLAEFHDFHGDVIFKPLDGMGGTSIFRVKGEDKNRGVILETLTRQGAQQIMGQKFIPEIKQGDSRILLINGEPIPYALARIPAEGENRGNLAAGGAGVGRELTDRDRFICEQVGPALREKGLYFVGIDVIGDYLTEVNVTCPTCIRELNTSFNLDIADQYMSFVESRILT